MRSWSTSLALALVLAACTSLPQSKSPASETAPPASNAEPRPTSAAAPAPVATELPSGGPALVRRNPQRPRALVLNETAGLERLRAATPKSAADYPLLLRRTAEAYSELKATAYADARSAAGKGDAVKAAELQKVGLAAGNKVIVLLQELANLRGPDAAQATYLLGVEHLRDDKAAESRKWLYEVISNYPKSPFVSDAYLLFGELFAFEAKTDPTKTELARQAFEKVVSNGKQNNTAYCFALFRVSEIQLARKQAEGVLGMHEAVECVDEVPKATGKAIILAQADALVRQSGVSAAPASPPPPAPVAVSPAAPAPAAVSPAAPAAPVASAVGNEPRHALVIGNGAYDSSPLSNPPRDARLVAATLRQVGFDVDLRVDADQAQMKRAISDLGAKLARGGVGFFYYAGHGMQVNGVNYLVPVRARIQREQDVDIEAVPLGRLLAEMDKARNRVNVVALDACRDNPFARSFRSGSRGLALSDAPMGTLISFATAPGSVASDGDGQNSPYSAALVHNITRRGVPVEEVFKGVRREVKRATAQHQTPWESSSLEGDFSFVP